MMRHRLPSQIAHAERPHSLVKGQVMLPLQGSPSLGMYGGQTGPLSTQKPVTQSQPPDELQVQDTQ